MKALLFIGGIYNLGFAIFHLFFWKLFKWKKDLAQVSPVNKAIFQVINIRLTYVFFAFAFLSVFFMEALLYLGIGKALLWIISLFWFGRALEQLIFFNFKYMASKVFFAVFVVGGILYLIPALAA